MGQSQLVHSFIDSGTIDLSVFGNQILQAAIIGKQADMVKFLIQKGVDMSVTPASVLPI